MKLRYLKIFFALLSGLSLAAAAQPASAAGGEVITNYTQTAKLDHDGSLTIATTFDYDFAAAAPHDVTYTIPLAYFDDQGREYRRAFRFDGAEEGGHKLDITPVNTPSQVQIVLPAGESTGTTRTYTVRYYLIPAIVTGPEGDIFKMAVAGPGWAVPINHATYRLESSTAPADNLTCFAGQQGTTSGQCSVGLEGNIAVVTSFATLEPGDSLTVFCNFPANSFTNYLKPYSATPAAPYLLLGGLGLGAAALIITPFVLIIRRRRYTKSHEAPTDKA